MEPDPLLDSLRNAVAAMPDDVPLRLHLAALLLRGDQRDEAVRHLGAVLQREPGNGEALAMLTTGTPGASGPAGPRRGRRGLRPRYASVRPAEPVDLPNGRTGPLPWPNPLPALPAFRQGHPAARPGGRGAGRGL